MITEPQPGKKYLWDIHYGTPQIVTVLARAEDDPRWVDVDGTYLVRNAKGAEFVLFRSQLKALPEELIPLAPLIGLAGKKRSGKDTVAGQLLAQYGVQRLAFADRLRRVLYGVNPIVSQYQYATGGAKTITVQSMVDSIGWESAKRNPEVRRLLQEIGTVYRTEVDMDAWVRPVIAEAEVLRRKGVPVVITDVRFPNEVEAVRAAGGLLVRIERQSVQLDETSQHISETALDETPADHVIHNDGSFDDLADAVNELGHMAQLDIDQLVAA
jgi:dephospho-CoA kinase